MSIEKPDSLTTLGLSKPPEPYATGACSKWSPPKSEPTDWLHRWAHGLPIPALIPVELGDAANNFRARREAAKGCNDLNGAFADCCTDDYGNVQIDREVAERRRIAVGLLRRAHSIDEVAALTGLYRSEVAAIAELQKSKGRL